MNMERYMLITEYENYAISNKGNVKNVISGKVLKPIKNSNGYFQVQLSKNNKKRTVRIHRLVAMMFIPNPETKPYVNHKNGIKTDNSVGNLEWSTHSENIRHAFKNKLIRTEKPVIITNTETGEHLVFSSTSECSRFLNSNNGSVNRVLKGKRNKHKGYYINYL
jgi:hypothetical protein